MRGTRKRLQGDNCGEETTGILAKKGPIIKVGQVMADAALLLTGVTTIAVPGKFMFSPGRADWRHWAAFGVGDLLLGG